MIDLHAHVLPGLDDGPATRDAALAQLELAAERGTRTIVATPHLRHDYPHIDSRRTAGAVDALMAEVPAEWGIRVIAGGEVDYAWGLEATDVELRGASIGGRGRDLLVETPHMWVPEFFDEAVSKLRDRGYRITLAHPELSRTFQEEPDRLRALVAAGTLLQITGASLERDPRKSRRGRFARRLLRDGLVTVIASDTHSAGPWRPPGLEGAVRVAREIAPERALWMATAAPAAIVAGRPLPPVPATAPAVRAA